MFGERDDRPKYWVIGRVDGYDHQKQVGSLRVVSWYDSEKERDKMMKELKEPGWVAMSKPFREKPEPNQLFKARSGLDKNLDREIERLRSLEQDLKPNRGRSL